MVTPCPLPYRIAPLSARSIQTESIFKYDIKKYITKPYVMFFFISYMQYIYVQVQNVIREYKQTMHVQCTWYSIVPCTSKFFSSYTAYLWDNP
jgi:hypothetical protein